jgi:hypothetical protein
MLPEIAESLQPVLVFRRDFMTSFSVLFSGNKL